MKKIMLITALLSTWMIAFGQDANVTVTREALGSGQPNATGVENATKWDNDIYHAPQYMPGYPTAASLYPRVVDVKCTKSVTTSKVECKGYNWSPEMGRGEYLMIHTIIEQDPAPPIVIVKTITKEVPVINKKIAE